ncbi:Ribonuclease H-like superfamily [Sesbania bispinosa]|nr:Ribonuclease H-like superfamily [Sesbania bispinosa]
MAPCPGLTPWSPLSRSHSMAHDCGSSSHVAPFMVPYLPIVCVPKLGTVACSVVHLFPPKLFCIVVASVVASLFATAFSPSVVAPSYGYSEGAKGDAGVHWRAWNVLTKSKKDGGLGFKEFSTMNLAHLAKQAWRIINNPEALWVRILKSIYFPNNSFLQVKKKYGGSWIWSSLMEGRDFAKRNGQWLIANGRDIHLWEDSWLWSKETLQQYSTGGDLRVADILNDADHTWDHQVLSTNLPSQVAIKARQTPIAWFQQRDKFYWPFSKDGNYTIKSGYQVARSEPPNRNLKDSPSLQIPQTLWKTIWHLKVPQKIKFFLWRACTNALPVAANLARRNIPIPSICPICNDAEETVEHAPVWFGSQLQWLPNPTNVTRFDMWDSSPSPTITLLIALHRVAAHWKRPLDGTLKINFDAAWSEANRGGAISVIVRDHKGALLGGHAKRVLTYSPLVAEALAIREGAMLAYNFNFHKVIFESDNLPLIEACRGERRLVEVDFIVQDIQTLVAGLLSSGFTWVRREGNKVAHHVATECARFELPLNWTMHRPAWLTDLLLCLTNHRECWETLCPSWDLSPRFSVFLGFLSRTFGLSNI